MTYFQKIFFLQKLSLQTKIRFMVSIMFLVIYFISGFNNLNSYSNEDYPLEADGGAYYRMFSGGWLNDDLALKHSITITFAIVVREIAQGLEGFLNKKIIIKAFFAIIGIINLLISWEIFCFYNKENSLLLTLIYGFSASIWFFSSIPESYIISVLFASLYLFLFLKFQNSWNFKNIFLLTAPLILGILNDITLIILLVIPLVFYNKELIKNAKERYLFIIHGLSAFLVIHIVLNFLSQRVHELSIYKYYLTYKQIWGLDTTSKGLYELHELLLNMLFFSIGFPSGQASYSSNIFPGYDKTFLPSLLQYFEHTFSTIFLLLFIILIVIFIYGFFTYRNTMSCALLSFIALKMGIIFWVHPWSSFMFSIVVNLPWLIVLSYYLQKSRFKYKTAFLIVFSYFNSFEQC